MSKPIPDGYTYTRCDIYTPDEFRSTMPKSLKEIVDQYIAENPKETYNTDDQIAVHHKRDEQYVGNCGRGTTKRYKFPEQAQNNK